MPLTALNAELQVHMAPGMSQGGSLYPTRYTPVDDAFPRKTNQVKRVVFAGVLP